MEINRIIVNGYGVLSDLSINLEPGLTIIYGLNGAGKSTLISFIRACFYGFYPRSSAQRYEPFNGGSHGGSLQITHNNKKYLISRLTDQRSKGLLKIENITTGEDVNQAFIEEILSGITQSVFTSVFAFDLNDLNELGLLRDHDLNAFLYSMGLGSSVSLSEANRRLTKVMDSIYKPLGHKPPLNRLISEMKVIDEQLQATGNLLGEYQDLIQQIRVGEQRVTQLKQQKVKLDDEIKATTLLLEGWKHWQKYETISQKLQQLSQTENNLQQAEATLHKVEIQHDIDQEKLVSATVKQTDINKKLGQIATQFSLLMPEILSKVELKTIQNWINQIEIIYSSVEQKPPRTAWLVRMVGLLVATGLGVVFFLLNHDVAFWTITFVIIFVIGEMLYTIRKQRICIQNNRRKLAKLLNQLGIESFSKNIAALKPIIDRDFELYREKRQLEELKNQVLAQISQLEQSVNTKQNQIDIWKQKVGEARNILELQYQAENVKTVLGTFFGKEHEEIEKLYQGINKESLICRYTKLQNEVDIIETQLEKAINQIGTYIAKKEDLENNQNQEALQLKLTTLETKADSLANKWAAYRVCQWAITNVSTRFERDKQPYVLKLATDYFKQITEGKYTRVFAPIGEKQLRVEANNGSVLSANALSRGTVEQLYLCLRLALAANIAKLKTKLPLIADDILVNFDHRRLQQAIAVIREISLNQQIILLTCHKSIARLFEQHRIRNLS